MNTTATELDLALVPGFESELRCESSHSHSVPCSEKVTHRVQRSCAHPVLICETRSKYFQGVWAMIRCNMCQSRVSDCWKVVPV